MVAGEYHITKGEISGFVLSVNFHRLEYHARNCILGLEKLLHRNIRVKMSIPHTVASPSFRLASRCVFVTQNYLTRKLSLKLSSMLLEANEYNAHS